jgi:hypothetical protein
MQSQIRKLTSKINAQFDLKDLGLSYQPNIFGLTAINPVTNRSSIRPMSNLQANTQASR